VDEARLERRRRVEGFQRLAHPLQAVGDRNENVLAAAALQIGKDLHPELGPSVCSIQRPRMSRLPSGNIAQAP